MSITASFWFLAGVLATVAVVLLLLPWLKSRSGAGAPLAGVPRWAPPALLITVVASLALYAKLGSPPAFVASDSVTNTHAMTDGAAAPGTAKANAGSMDVVVTALEARLLSKPGTDADWELLAKSYEFLGRADAAVLARAHQLPSGAGKPPASMSGAVPATAVAQPALTPASEKLLVDAAAARRKQDFKAAQAIYRKLAAANQLTADGWADFADVSAVINGKSLNGEPESLLQRALLLDPQNSKALWLQGSFEHNSGRYREAISTWQRLAATMAPASSDARLIAANIAEDQQLAGGAAAAGGVVVVRGEVTISDQLRSKIKPGMTLFIVAKSVNSPGPPVAVIRTTTGAWPLVFELNDSQSMLPERKLSTAGAVTVEARVSLSGQALSQPGDLLGSTAPLRPRDGKALKIVIQKVVG
jgi:cytochrome c-type biogenesis protein CcmH/NrfG